MKTLGSTIVTLSVLSRSTIYFINEWDHLGPHSVYVPRLVGLL